MPGPESTGPLELFSSLPQPAATSVTRTRARTTIVGRMRPILRAPPKIALNAPAARPGAAIAGSHGAVRAAPARHAQALAGTLWERHHGALRRLRHRRLRRRARRHPRALHRRPVGPARGRGELDPRARARQALGARARRAGAPAPAPPAAAAVPGLAGGGVQGDRQGSRGARDRALAAG